MTFCLVMPTSIKQNRDYTISTDSYFHLLSSGKVFFFLSWIFSWFQLLGSTFMLTFYMYYFLTQQCTPNKNRPKEMFIAKQQKQLGSDGHRIMVMDEFFMSKDKHCTHNHPK